MTAVDEMPLERARELLRLAEAANVARYEPDEAPLRELIEAADEVGPAAERLLQADPAAALRLVGVLPVFWQDVGRVDEGRALTEQAIAEATMGAPGRDPSAAGDGANPAVMAALPWALEAAAELAFRQGDQPAAEAHAAAAIEAARRVGDTACEGMAWTFVARVAYRHGDAEGIERHSRRALDVAPGDRAVRRSALHMLAWAAHTAGDRDEARRRFHESLAYRRSLGNRLSVSVELANLGDMADEDGDSRAAAGLLGEALAIARDLDNQYMIVNTLPSFAALAVGCGWDDDAGLLFGAADAVARRTGLVPDPGSAKDMAREQLRSRMDSARFDGLLARGDALATDDAVRLAADVGARVAAREA